MSIFLTWWLLSRWPRGWGVAIIVSASRKLRATLASLIRPLPKLVLAGSRRT